MVKNSNNTVVIDTRIGKELTPEIKTNQGVNQDCD